MQRFDKSLEEFYALCDQLELSLVSLRPGPPARMALHIVGGGGGAVSKAGRWRVHTQPRDLAATPGSKNQPPTGVTGLVSGPGCPSMTVGHPAGPQSEGL